MLNRCLFLLIMFVFSNNVESKGDSDEVGERNVYNFNHPPLEEYYNPIPVAVVYEEESGYEEKSEITNKADKPVKSGKAIKLNEKELTTTEREETTTGAVKSFDRSTVEFKPKPRALNEYQIPVAVVYDSDSSNYQNYKRTTDNNTPKRRVIKRKKQQTKSNFNVTSQSTPKEDEPTQVKLNVQTEKPTAKVETSIFKKRTEGQDPVVPIVELENYVFSHNGNFHYSYEGGDGTKAFSEGMLKTVEEKRGEAVVGGFSYTDKEGNDFSLTYTADENGYRPMGAHLPTPPPIPPAIARALKYLATATPEPVTNKPAKSESLPIKSES